MKTELNLEDFNIEGAFQYQISDHPLTGLRRVINYRGANIREDFKMIEHIGDMHYFNTDGIHLSELTHKVRQRGKDWRVDNSYEVIERDLNTGIPILNSEGEQIKYPAFDYFIQIVFNSPAPLKNIIQSSIDLDDSNKLFD